MVGFSGLQLFFLFVLLKLFFECFFGELLCFCLQRGGHFFLLGVLQCFVVFHGFKSVTVVFCWYQVFWSHWDPSNTGFAEDAVCQQRHNRGIIRLQSCSSKLSGFRMFFAFVPRVLPKAASEQKKT